MSRNCVKRWILNEFTTLGLIVIATLGISVLIMLYAAIVLVINLVI